MRKREHPKWAAKRKANSAPVASEVSEAPADPTPAPAPPEVPVQPEPEPEREELYGDD